MTDNQMRIATYVSRSLTLGDKQLATEFIEIPCETRMIEAERIGGNAGCCRSFHSFRSYTVHRLGWRIGEDQHFRAADRGGRAVKGKRAVPFLLRGARLPSKAEATGVAGQGCGAPQPATALGGTWGTSCTVCAMNAAALQPSRQLARRFLRQTTSRGQPHLARDPIICCSLRLAAGRCS